MKVWSIIPMLRFEEGHPYGYNLAVGRACRINNWMHGALVPASCAIDKLPETWKKVLADDFFTDKGCKIIWKKPSEKALTLLKSIKPLCSNLFLIKKEKGEKVLFMEQFFLGQILAFGFAIFFVNPGSQIWLLHRYSIKQMGFKSKIYHIIHKLIEMRCGEKNLKLLCDSTLLAEDLSSYFKKEVDVMPIPHTQDPIPLNGFRKVVKYLMWWPGGFTSEAKGLSIIKKVANLKSENFKLVVAESAKEHMSDLGIDVEFIKSHLSRQDYVCWMQVADLILLPYDPLIYHFSTSGIFVEAIVYGKIPLVKEGTWMAAELKKFELQELIIDWENTNIFAYFESLLKDQYIIQKLSVMQKNYRQFHSEASFADKMNFIFHR
jgi:hypothetical protein